MKNDIPTYSKGEEIFNGVTHIVGGGLGVVFLTISLILEALHGGNALRLFALSVYGLSMIVLYVMSSLYHMIRPPRAKRVMRVFDHCSIFFLIAGTYAPLIILGVSDRKGYLLLGFVGLMAVLGITFNAIDLNGKAVKILSYALYIVMGWCVILIFPELKETLPPATIVLLFSGGLFYTGGFVFYALGKRKKWFHSIWHLFVLAGSILHFIAILFLLI